jgi:hypothetical protein
VDAAFLAKFGAVLYKLKIVTVGRTEVTSNEVKIPPSTCGGQVCDVGYCAADADNPDWL